MRAPVPPWLQQPRPMPDHSLAQGLRTHLLAQPARTRPLQWPWEGLAQGLPWVPHWGGLVWGHHALLGPPPGAVQAVEAPLLNAWGGQAAHGN